MPPKDAGNAGEKILVLRAVGGEVAPPSTLAPKVGPLGLNPKKVGDDIAAATKMYKGLKVTVELKVLNRQAEVSLRPSAALLIIQALKEPARDRKKVKNIKHNGNISFEDVLEVARKMRSKSNAKTYVGTVKEILGTCVSVGCKVNGSDPRDLQQQISDGNLEVPEK
jgi:large subunit ribosomal protein L12e